MRRMITLGLAILMCLGATPIGTPAAASSGIASADGQDYQSASPAVSNAPAFNTAVFRQSVLAAVDGRVKGYSFVIADRKDIQLKVSGGFAQAPPE